MAEISVISQFLDKNSNSTLEQVLNSLLNCSSKLQVLSEFNEYFHIPGKKMRSILHLSTGALKIFMFDVCIKHAFVKFKTESYFASPIP